jgi:hypothetical protein
MSSSGARRTGGATLGNMSLPLLLAVSILLGGIALLTTGVLAASERQAVLDQTTLIDLVAVVVEQQDEALAVRLQTSRTPRYSVTSRSDPERIIIDVEGAHHAWHGTLTGNPAPITGVRGSQWKPGIARVVVELSRQAGYSIEERSDGLVLRLDAGTRSRGPQVAQVEPSTVADGGSGRLIASKDSPRIKGSSAHPSIKGQVEVGYRGFLFDRGQELIDNNVDLMGELDSTFDLSRTLRLRLHPRLAIDPLEPARDRFEPYDAYVEYTAEAWTILVGQFLENWASVERFSPADLLNRRDVERNFYDPGKLGELMVRLRLSLPEGDWIQQPTISLYALPLFRSTPLPTNRDRFRLDITGDNVGDLTNKIVHPSFDAGFAARSTVSVGRADLSLFYYGGPGRIPSFALDPRYQAPRLTPVYYRADSVGASAQGAFGPWVLKGETVYTITSASGLPGTFKAAVPDSYFQYVVGVDRTFTDVFGKSELTVSLEYSGENDPGVTSLTGLRPFKSDFFLGARWQFHDHRRTEVRAFLAADVLESEQLWLVNFETTVYGNLKLLLEGQFVNRGESKPPDHLSVFGLFPNNANIRVALRYEF